MRYPSPQNLQGVEHPQNILPTERTASHFASFSRNELGENGVEKDWSKSLHVMGSVFSTIPEGISLSGFGGCIPNSQRVQRDGGRAQPQMSATLPYGDEENDERQSKVLGY